MSAARFNDSEIAWATESSTSPAAKTSIITGCEIVTWFELEGSDSDDEDSDDEDSDDEDSDDEDSDDEDSDDEDSDDEEHDVANNSVTTKASQTFTKSPLHRTANGS
ncbi:MAG: hypothetical protein VX734_05725 [Actinomycetota bacterium]|nr:hypothetical protein [Actinomycetota bacterium]